MYDLIAEKPIVTSAMIAAFVIALVAMWLKDGRRSLIIAAGVCALMIPGAWLLANRLVTDRERIEEIIQELAVAIEANEPEQTLEYLGSETLKSRATSELVRYQFSNVRASSPKRFELLDERLPAAAEVELNVKVIVSERNGMIRDVTAARKLLLRLVKNGKTPDGEQDWRIVDYAHYPLIGNGPDNYSAEFSQTEW